MMVLLCALLGLLAGAAPSRLSSADLQPYFARGAGRQGAQRYRAGDFKAAAPLLEEWQKHAPKEERLPAELLSALALQKRGDHAAAASKLEAVSERWRLLAPLASYRAAVSRFQLGQYKEAIAAARAVGPDSPLRDDAELLVGDALRSLGQLAETREQYARYLGEHPKGARRPEALFRRAEADERLGKRAEAISGYQEVVAEAPVDPWAGQAQARLSALGAAPRTPALQELLARGNAQFRAQQLGAAERTFAEAARKAGANTRLLCEAQYMQGQSVFRQRQRARSTPLFEASAGTCKKAGHADYAARSLYQAGRGLLARKESEAAAATFLRLEAEHPKHTYADDARVRASEAYASIDDKDPRIEPTLAEVPKRHPDGDMKAEALFRLVFRALRAGDAARAQKWIDQSLRLVPREVGWAEEGRTLYWLGRLRERGKDEKGALAAWERCVREYPLSYYALLSANRLAEASGASIEALLGELGRTAARDGEWQLPEHAVYAEPGFRRGLELVKMGLFEEARRELAKVGVGPLTREEAKGLRRPGEPASDEDDEDDDAAPSDDMGHPRWAIALVLHRAEMFERSHAVPRYALFSWHDAWPKAQNRKRWELAFPKAFAHDIEAGARAAQIPAELAWAIAREESAFNPSIRSNANALGLMQLLVATAKRSAPSGLKVNKTSLLDPRVNAACGARELASLLGRYQGNYALAIAGYNAGAGAVSRWLAERGQLPLDEFVELIPFDETRGYTKRVLSSLFTYQFLYGERSARLPRLFPARSAAPGATARDAQGG